MAMAMAMSLRLSVCCLLSVCLSARCGVFLPLTGGLCTRAISTTNDVVLNGPKSVLRPESGGAPRSTLHGRTAERNTRIANGHDRACFCERARRVWSKNSWQIENNDVVSRTVGLGEATQRQIERQTESQERQRHRLTDRQRDKEADRRTDKPTDRQTDRETKYTEWQTDRHIDRNRQRERQIERHNDRPTKRQKQTEKQTEKQVDRQTNSQTNKDG